VLGGTYRKREADLLERNTIMGEGGGDNLCGLNLTTLRKRGESVSLEKGLSAGKKGLRSIGTFGCKNLFKRRRRGFCHEKSSKGSAVAERSSTQYRRVTVNVKEKGRGGGTSESF